MTAPHLLRNPNEVTREAVAAALTGRRSDWAGTVFKALLMLAISLTLAILCVLVASQVVQGAPVLTERFGSFLTGTLQSLPEEAGIHQGLRGSLWIGIFVAVLAFPLGVAAAVYLEEYAPRNRFTRFIDINIRNLAGVPSIVYGILGLAFIVRGPLDLGTVALSASLTLTLLILPTIIIAAREAVRAVPPSIREGALALGATRWETTRHQVLPAATPGIITGVILAVSRAFGEAAPLLLIGATTFVTANTANPLEDPYTTLPVQIFNYFGRAQEEWLELAAAGIIVMLVLVLALNSVAIWLRNRYEQNW